MASTEVDQLYAELDQQRPNSSEVYHGAPGSAGSVGTNGVEGNVVAMELEHAIGFSGLRSSVHVVPNSSKYYFVAGGCVVAANLEDTHDQTFLRAHDADITAFKLSRSGRFLLSGQKGHNADVVLWEVGTHQQVHRIHEHEGGVLALDISPDDSIIGSIGEERRLSFFDASNGGLITFTPLLTVIPPTDVIQEVVVGPRVQDVKRRDTQLVHVCVVTSTMLLAFHLDPYNATLTPVRYNTSSFQRRLITAQYTNDGDFLIVGSEAGDVALINTQSCSVVATARVCSIGIRELVVAATEGEGSRSEEGAAGNFRYARFGPGSERKTTFFIGGGDGSVVGCTIPEHSNPSVDVFAKMKLDSSVTSISVIGASRVSHRVVAGTAKGSILSLQLATPTAPIREEDKLQLISDAVCAPFDCMASHPAHPERFVTANKDGLLRQWDLNSYRLLGVFEFATKNEGGRTPLCTSIQICAGLEIMLSSWDDGCVRCHDLTTYTLLWTHAKVHRTAVTALVLSPSAKYYVTGSAEGEIKMWDIRSRELKGELKDHRQAIISLQLFDDDKHLLSGSRDRTLVAWDLVTMRRVAQLETHAGPLTSMLLCRNQYNVYTGSADHTLAMWDIRQREPARTVRYCPPGSEAHCTTISRSVDERLLATGGTDQIVQLWDERRLKPVSTGYGHSGDVVQTTFTSDNKQVLSCGADSCVMVWNVYASNEE